MPIPSRACDNFNSVTFTKLHKDITKWIMRGTTIHCSDEQLTNAIVQSEQTTIRKQYTGTKENVTLEVVDNE